ncbi:MAG: class I SAM-dependent methyltransferase [Candidatus Paceibacterota bacterium]
MACGSPKTAFSFKKCGYDFWRCFECGFIFIFPLPESGNIYSKDYFSGALNGFGYVDYDSDKEPMENWFKKVLAIISKNAGGKGKLLDVGAATGYFVELAAKNGWRAEGLEISDYAASLGRKKGLDIKTGTLLDSNFAGGAFDVVTMFDVLEHFADPRKEIFKAAELLKKGGLLVINTPDAGSFYAKILGKRWHLFIPPEHICYFNQKNIGIFMQKAGLNAVYRSKIGKKFTLEYIFKTLHKWQKLGIWNLIGSILKTIGLNKLSILVNLRDNMLIIAVKGQTLKK